MFHLGKNLFLLIKIYYHYRERERKREYEFPAESISFCLFNQRKRRCYLLVSAWYPFLKPIARSLTPYALTFPLFAVHRRAFSEENIFTVTDFKSRTFLMALLCRSTEDVFRVLITSYNFC